jgi:hypothetical protein
MWRSLLVLVGYESLAVAFQVLRTTIFKVFKVKFSNNIKFSYRLISQLSYLYFSTNVFAFLFALSRIKSINECFKFKPQTFAEAQKALRDFSTVHAKFSDSINLLNKCFSLIVILRTFKFIFHIALIFFALYNIITIESSQQTKALFITGCFYNSLELFLFLPLLAISSSIKQQNSKFVSSFALYQQLLQQNFKAPELEKIQTPSQDISVSCGLFEVDWNLFLMTLTAIFSSLIVLIQFDQAMRRP